jgi:hypothetical protein
MNALDRHATTEAAPTLRAFSINREPPALVVAMETRRGRAARSLEQQLAVAMATWIDVSNRARLAPRYAYTVAPVNADRIESPTVLVLVGLQIYMHHAHIYMYGKVSARVRVHVAIFNL